MRHGHQTSRSYFSSQLTLSLTSTVVVPASIGTAFCPISMAAGRGEAAAGSHLLLADGEDRPELDAGRFGIELGIGE